MSHAPEQQKQVASNVLTGGKSVGQSSVTSAFQALFGVAPDLSSVMALLTLRLISVLGMYQLVPVIVKLAIRNS